LDASATDKSLGLPAPAVIFDCFSCDNRIMLSRASKGQTLPESDPILLVRSAEERVTAETWRREPLEERPEKIKNPHAVALSKLGASKGGKARAESLTAKQRSKIAKKAAQTRWNKT
jgi:hypothetical protein